MKQAVGRPHICDMPRRPEAEQRGFFEDVLALAKQADARPQSRVACISIAGTSIQLRFSSQAMAQNFLPALAHLRIENLTQPDAVFYIWDSKTSGVAMRPAPCEWDCFTDRGDIWGFDSERFRSAFHWSDWSLNLMDMETNIGIYWVDSGDDLVYWTKASPFRTLFGWLLAKRGCQLLHAAAVATEAGAVLIAGKGGVGKSTTALSCLEAGMNYLADDYLVVQLDPEPRVFSLYATAKLEVPQLQKFPALHALLKLAALDDIAADEKAVLHLLHEGRHKITLSMPLTSALTPRFGTQPGTTFKPAPMEQLVHAAAFTTMSQLPHSGRETYAFIERLMRRLPCFEMLLGHDIAAIPQALRGFIADTKNFAAPAVLEEARPFISVIIPVYNAAHFLRESVASILAQHYTPLEIIVVDDGSEDDLPGAVAQLGIDVRLLRQPNLGPAAARNLGLRNAIGEYFALLDADDLWPPGMLRGLAAQLSAQPELDVIHGYGQLIRSDLAGGQEFIGSARETFPYYLSAALYRRCAFERVGLFDAELRFSEDTDWFTRAREAGIGIQQLEQVTLLVRRHDGNMTKDKNLRELGALRIFKKALDRRRQLQAKHKAV